MKWFFALVVVLNLLVAGYTATRQRAPIDIHAQEVNPGQLKALPADWLSSSAPRASVAPMATASAPIASRVSSAPLAKAPASAPVGERKSKAQAKPVKRADDPIKKATASSAASSVAAASLPCMQWGGLNDTLLARVQAGLHEVKLGPGQFSTATVLSSVSGSSGNLRYWVYYPEQASGAVAQSFSDELKAKGFDNYVVQNEGQFHGTLSLGLYSSEVSAKAMIEHLKAAGFDKAEVFARGPKGATMLNFKSLSPAQVKSLTALQKRLTPGISLKDAACAK